MSTKWKEGSSQVGQIIILAFFFLKVSTVFRFSRVGNFLSIWLILNIQDCVEKEDNK